MPGYGGKDVIAIWKKGSTWGTAVQGGAGEALAIHSDGINHDIGVVADEAAGQAFQGQQDQGLISVDASPSMDMRYQGPDRLLAAIMGAAAAPAQQDATSAYLHALTLADDLDGIFGTFAVGFGAKAHEIPSAKAHGFTLSGEAGQVLQLAVNLLGDNLVLDDNGVNTIATLASATLDDEANRVLFNQAVFRINAAAGDALGSSDKINPRAFQLSFNRPHSSDYQAEADTIIEPTANGFPETRLRLEFPIYDADTWLSAFRAATVYKADLTFTGATIEGAYSYQLQFEFPRLVPVSADRPQVSGAEKFSNAIEFNCLRAASAPTGMSGLTAPFRCDVINARTTTALA
jgi:hypothetical protein